MIKSKYNQLSVDEKIKLFSGPENQFSIENEDELNFYVREKRGFEILEDFILSIGGSEISGRLVETKDNQIIDNLSIGMNIPFTGQHKTKFKQGVVYKTKEFQCWDTFSWSDNKWLNCNGNRCYFQNLKLQIIPHLNSICNTEIVIYKRIKEEKGFFSKKQFVEHTSLYPFIDNLVKEKINYIPDSKDYGNNYSLKRELYDRPLDFWSFVEQNNFSEYFLDMNDIKILKDLYKVLDNFIIDVYKEYIEIPKKKEFETKKKVQTKIKKIIINEFDKDGNGKLDIIEDDNLIMDLLEKNQSLIVDFDFKLVQDIIKLNRYLNTKKENLLKIFELFKSIETESELSEILHIFRTSIENYQSLILHTLNMIVSIKEKQMITYYELYECFDKMGVFESNWESEVSTKLSSIEQNLDNISKSLMELIFSVKSMEHNISSRIDTLTYVTKSSYESLNSSLTSELKSIRSGIGLNNLLNGIQTYQLYKINKNTKKEEN